MSKKVYVNSKTGEIVELEEVCPFASLTDPKKEGIKDVESYKAGTSVTSLEGYEPLESIVARCMRMVQSPNGVTYQVLDRDALKAEETGIPVYEAEGAQSLDEAFATVDPTDSQGFDLADASVIQNVVAERLRNVKASDGSADLSTKGKSAVPQNEASDVVGKSESTTESAFPEKKENISNDGK